MPLPTPGQMRELQKSLRLSSLSDKPTYGTADKVRNTLSGMLRKAGGIGATMTAQSVVTSMSGAATHMVPLGVGGMSVALFPIGAALAPWIGAAKIAYASDGIFALHDLKSFAAGERGAHYPCSCGKCADGLRYVINKKEVNFGIAAVSIFTAGLPLLVDRANSVRKSFQTNRPKEQYSKQFVESARGGCVNAMAAIMLMCGKWPRDGSADPELYIEAVTCIIADDGWKLVKSKW
jgi:hypothetical protein